VSISLAGTINSLQHLKEKHYMVLPTTICLTSSCTNAYPCFAEMNVPSGLWAMLWGYTFDQVDKFLHQTESIIFSDEPAIRTVGNAVGVYL
jgi:hypothetical protein